MKIRQLEFNSKALEWKLEKTDFQNLTLLVGISGVGKTQILNSIWSLRRIANGATANGIKWQISFVAKNGDDYCWLGEFENNFIENLHGEFWNDDRFEDIKDDKPKIICERLVRNGKTVIERDEANIFLKGQKTPKLSPFESVLNILNQEEDITPASESFKQIIRSDFSDKGIYPTSIPEFNKTLNRNPTLEYIQESNLDSRLKIALVYKCLPDVFEQIKQRFIEVFPYVEDVRFESEKANSIFPFLEDYPLIQIKEKGVKEWIHENKISSGMYKTFMHISELYLLPSGTVVLIDEFENSLGVNCIDVLTEDLLQESRNLQFIVTSHHPYIINNISPRFWKVVTREGGIVKTQDASELQLDKSSHKAFIQLVNHEEYLEGVAVS